MSNLDLYNKFRKVPQEAKKAIQGGRLKGFTDINPMWRIKALTEEFGACGAGWYTEVIDKTTFQAGDEIGVFLDLNLFIRKDDNWSKPIFGTGGSMLLAKERGGLYFSDECYKMAYTDALSVACKALGIGADVYFEKDSSKYDKLEATSDVCPKCGKKAKGYTSKANKWISPEQELVRLEMCENCYKKANEAGD